MEGSDRAAERLHGTWRLVSNEWRMEDTGEIITRTDPRGFAVFEPGGRAMFLLTVAGRAAPTNEAETAALYMGMTAYTGRCRVQGDRVVVAVDVAWHPTWEGTEQVRFFEVDGDRLTLRTGVQAHPRFPGRAAVGTFIWTRER